MLELRGIGGAPGFAMAVAAVKREGRIVPARRTVADPEVEVRRFQEARTHHMLHLESLYAETLEKLGDNEAEIFRAHQTILQDDYFFGQALERITNEGVAADYAIYREKLAVAETFAQLDDEYLKERLTDIETVCHDLIRLLNGEDGAGIVLPDHADGVIIVAEDLTPADTVRMDKTRLKGMVTEKGGVTSHTVILAKALGIPAVVGVTKVLERIPDGAVLLLDGARGEIIANPSENAVSRFRDSLEKDAVLSAAYKDAEKEIAVTLDGKRIGVNMNMGDAQSMSVFNKDVCDGVGLFRTEFLYMDCRDYPGEEEQFAVYREMAEKAGGKEVIIRTLDIGGDKQLEYMDLPVEDNPFLGYRAIRICLDRPEIFNTQLRAILRASVHGDVKIMFPMIVSLDEVKAARAAVGRAMDELDREGLPFNREIRLGIMVETPAAVFVSDQLARHVDFFSVGSNDLIQYVTASDRMNGKVGHIYDCCNVAVLRAIRLLAENAAKAGIPVGICGEVASEARLVPLWAALGIAELSVAPSLLGRVKYILGKTNAEHAAAALSGVFDCESADEARALLDGFLEKALG